jgi:uncharacterized protein (UPF0333 family)
VKELSRKKGEIHARELWFIMLLILLILIIIIFYKVINDIIKSLAMG